MINPISKAITVFSDITVQDAMKVLNKTAEKCLLVVDKDNKLIGTLTDGDIRRFILNGANFDEAIDGAYCIKPSFLIESDYSTNKAKKLIIDNKLDVLPIINKENRLIGYVTWNQIIGEEQSHKKQKIDIPVIIMAGGEGTRLKPFTNVLPKPLIPINEKPVIEHIIQCFTNIGCLNFYITINYKSKILKAFFEELNPSYQVNFIKEEKPLGTAGILSSISNKIGENVFISNCDIIIDENYKKVYDFHIKNKFDITLVASAKKFTIPYGTCEINKEGHLSQINEKPVLNHLINTGLYIINTDLFSLIPRNQFFHMTDLIANAKKNGKTIGVFPVDEDSWIDIGQWSEYKKSIDLFNS